MEKEKASLNIFNILLFQLIYSAFSKVLDFCNKLVEIFRLDEFMEGFNTISLKLKEMYQVC